MLFSILISAEDCVRRKATYIKRNGDIPLPVIQPTSTRCLLAHRLVIQDLKQ
jgi:hypothetical protein